MTRIELFCTADCPRCESVKKALKGIGAQYEAKDMATAESITELRVAGVFTMSAPVLRVDDRYYTTEDLFDDMNLKVKFGWIGEGNFEVTPSDHQI